jgi:hypothetical protein
MDGSYKPNNVPEAGQRDRKIITYESYYNQVLVKEQPFYYQGMSELQADRELEYLNEHLKAFYEGEYTPLWRQNLYK